MSATRTGGELGDLRELRRVLGRCRRDVEHTADDVGHAIDRFRSRSSEFLPHLPPHEARGRGLAERLDEVAQRVERTHDAVAAADAWVGRGLLGRAVAVEGGRQTALGAWEVGVGAWTRTRPWLLDQGDDRRRWSEAGRLLRGQLDGGWKDVVQTVDGSGWRGHLTDSLQDARRLAGRGAGAATRFGASVGDDAGRLARAWGAVSDARIGAVGRLASRGVGVLGVVTGGLDAWEGHREGDTEQVVTGGLGAVAGAAMFVPCPPVQAAAAVVSAGLLVYEYRDEIAAAGRAVADAARRDLARRVEVARDVAGAAGDIADAAWSAVKGLF